MVRRRHRDKDLAGNLLALRIVHEARLPCSSPHQQIPDDDRAVLAVERQRVFRDGPVGVRAFHAPERAKVVGHLFGETDRPLPGGFLEGFAGFSLRDGEFGNVAGANVFDFSGELHLVKSSQCVLLS